MIEGTIGGTGDVSSLVIVSALIITAIVFEAGFAFAREFGPAVAIIPMSVAGSSLVAMRYVVFRAIGKLFADRWSS